MITTARARSERQTTATRPLQPLLSVIAWELRRIRASRSTWVIALLTFGLFLLGIWSLWLLKFAGSAGFGSGATFTVAVTSPQGLVMTLPVCSFLLALLLPFVNAEGAVYDLKQRAHELLMATPVPTWVYIWGRYLAGLLVSLGLAVLLLISLLLMGLMLNQTQTDYPPPQPAATLAIWAVVLLPTTILISSASFALGAMLQRNASLVKIGMTLVWFVCALFLPAIPLAGSGQLPRWYLFWEPTNTGTSALLQAFYEQRMNAIFDPLPPGRSDSAILAALANLEQQMPDLRELILPHLVWAAFGLALVALVALTFTRFKNSLD